MLNALKEMQIKGIFKLDESDLEIDALIEKAETENDISNCLSDIQKYIKNLDINLSIDSDSVEVNQGISDFNDKFQYTMFEMYMNSIIINNSIYQQELSLGTAGTATFGISSNNSIKFTIQERKLLKLINHYYIRMNNDSSQMVNSFYIPTNKLKSIYVEDVNNLQFKESIIETCNKLNSKRLYWDMSKSKYNTTKELKKNKLSLCKNEPLVDITIIYYPRSHSKGVDGTVNTIKGIYCKVTNFMKLRYAIKQISNLFPAEALRYNYLEFIIAQKFFYHINIIKANNEPRIKKLQDPRVIKAVRDKLKKNIKTEYKVCFIDLLRELYYYDDEQTKTDYYKKILTEANSKRRIQEVLKSLANIAADFANHKLNLYIIVKGKNVELLQPNGKCKKSDIIYKEMAYSISKKQIKGQVLRFIGAKEVSINVKF